MRLLQAFLVAALAFGSVASAEEPPPWANNPDYKSLAANEAKVLGRLLTEALKADYRRQAVYLARRILTLQPDEERAQVVLTQWKPEDFDGAAPKSKFLKKLDDAIKKFGHAYFKFGEKLEAAGVDPEVYYPLNIRALSDGCDAGPLVSTIREAGELWMGTFKHHPTQKVKAVVGSAMYELGWPFEWDDDFLRFNAIWPECSVATLRTLRLITDVPWGDALRVLRGFEELELYLIERMGGKAPKKQEMISIAVCNKGETYEMLVPVLFSKRTQDAAMNSSAFYNRWRRSGITCWQHRNNAFVKGEQLALGLASRALVRTHLAGTAGGSVRGKGAWLFDGVAGAFEALDWSDEGFTEINIRRAWRVAVARALRDAGKLLDWDHFFELDQAAAREVDRVSLQVAFDGKTREVKNADVVAAQATALVIGLLKADPKRSPKRVGKLIAELVKRDSLPNIDKTMGWKKGRAVREAEKAMDSAGG